MLVNSSKTADSSLRYWLNEAVSVIKSVPLRLFISSFSCTSLVLESSGLFEPKGSRIHIKQSINIVAAKLIIIHFLGRRFTRILIFVQK